MAGEKSVVVVGAGLSGLCCARTIQRAGSRCEIYEASDAPGGRVRTDDVDGFLLDRGFQVMFTGYPAIRQEMDLELLRLRPFDPGALIYAGGRRFPITDPFRKPTQAFSMATSPLFSMQDKLNVAKLRTVLLGKSVDEIFTMPDMTTEAFLRGLGFSSQFLDNFARPFFGGIFLERELQTSARMFAFVFKMLSVGDTVVPEQGMGALGRQLAEDLVPGTLHLNSPVRELTRQGERVTGIRLEDGTTIEADMVVIATEPDQAARLTGLSLPMEARASTCLYFALKESLYREKSLLLFPQPDALVNNAVQISNVAPSYAPAGQHLLSATVLGDPPQSDEELARLVRTELGLRFPDAVPEAWNLLRVYRVRWAQVAQNVGIWNTLPAPKTSIPGLILAGEITVSSSLHGALAAGQRAAGLALSVVQ